MHLSKDTNFILKTNQYSDMPIVINLDVMMAKRKMSLTELSETLGISFVKLSMLKTGKMKGIRFTTLEAICKTLECQPGDILEYLNDKDYKKLMG
jgi:putative transcriptional regulator